MDILGIIYVIGAIIAFMISVYEMARVYKSHHKHIGQYGMIAQMTLLSWVTVFVYIYSKLSSKR